MNKNQAENQPPKANKVPTPAGQPAYSVQRAVLLHDQFVAKSGYVQPAIGCMASLKQCCATCSCLGFMFNMLPILEWLRGYRLLRDLPDDIAAGITVGILNIPHGIAYAVLAGLPPQSGLSMAVLPVLVYMMFGTSRHISIGTFSVAGIMTLKVVRSHLHDKPPSATANLEIATALAMAVGIVQLIMWLLRLGALAALLSEPLVNGFLSGCACHVATSQLCHIFGVQISPHNGYFKMPLAFMDTLLAMPKSNIITCLIAACVIVCMIISNECLKPWLKRYCRFPLPSELMLIMLGILIAHWQRLHERFGVVIVGKIPAGLPAPVVPSWQLVWQLMIDCLPIAIVSYSTIISLGLSMARAHNYQLRTNQELLALGLSNLVTSLFMGYPLSASLSRSLMQSQTGGKTQIASAVSAALIVTVMLWLSPVFTELPKCVLAGIIIVALKPLFLQIKVVKTHAAEGQLEMWTWIFTFLTVVIVDIDIGLYVGLCCSLLMLWMNGYRAGSLLLGTSDATAAVYASLEHHANLTEPANTKIFRYAGALNFASRLTFQQRLHTALQLEAAHQQQPVNAGTYLALVIDLSMVAHLDVAGCRMLHDLSKDMNERGVRLLLACPSDNVYDRLGHAWQLGIGPFDIFATLHDAVEYAKACRASN